MDAKSKYDSNIHHRRSIRLKGFDYSLGGLYFITICCHQMECRFGRVENEAMVLNDAGQIAYDEWIKLPAHFSNMELDVFQIMPNHMHGIIALTSTIGQPQGIAPTIGDIVGAYKSLVVTACLDEFKQKDKSLVPNNHPQLGKIWQRNYHEHIIRNEESYKTISAYIINNPANWIADKFYKS